MGWIHDSRRRVSVLLLRQLGMSAYLCIADTQPSPICTRDYQSKRSWSFLVVEPPCCDFQLGNLGQIFETLMKLWANSLHCMFFRLFEDPTPMLQVAMSLYTNLPPGSPTKLNVIGSLRARLGCVNTILVIFPCFSSTSVTPPSGSRSLESWSLRYGATFRVQN